MGDVVNYMYVIPAQSKEQQIISLPDLTTTDGNCVLQWINNEKLQDSGP